METNPENPLRITYIGTATALLEIGTLRLLTDPALDPAGKYYGFGFGLGSRKTADPVMPEGGLGRIDAVLLSHDQHADNLDDGGRAFLPQAGQVLTTTKGAKRLGGNSVGLAPWAKTSLTDSTGLKVTITATPARHGPWGSLPFLGHVIGFVLEWAGQQRGALYISGDTVDFKGTREIGRRFRIGTALLHLGGVGFGLTGPVRYTMTAARAKRLASAIGAPHVVPLHFEDWSHFLEPRERAVQTLAPTDALPNVTWLKRGVPRLLDV